MIKNVIFDLDGLLIDSMPVWVEAEIPVFKKLGIDLTKGRDPEVFGLDMAETIEHYYEKNPWPNYDLQKTLAEVNQIFIELIKIKGDPRPGVDYILDFFKNKNLPLAIASCSSYEVIEVILEKLKIKDHFQVIHSTDDEKHGKPNPAVYLSTAKKLNTQSENCLVFEDSTHGILAAKSAGMKTIIIPDPSLVNDPEVKLADFILPSLDRFTESLWRQLN